MESLLWELVPFGLGLAVTPAAIAAGILMLGSKRPVANDVAFASPFVVAYALISGAVLVASGASSEPLVDDHGKSVAALVVGLVLLVLAVAGVVRHRRKGTPHKASLLARIDSATPAAAAGIGAVLAVLNPNVAILLGGLSAIVAADVSGADQVVAAGFLVVASVMGIVVPLLWYLLRPARARRGLQKIRSWLGHHEHALNVGVLAVFGVVFTIKGLQGL